MATLFGCFNRRVSAVGWILDANGQIGYSDWVFSC